jgi:hypothetical protein
VSSSQERRRAILHRLLDQGEDFTTSRLCRVCADFTGVTGAGIMLMAGDVHRGSVCTTDVTSSLLAQLQFDLGEGPCVDAYRQDRPVFEPDLVAPGESRWLAFSGPAIEAGARAVFGFPLQVGAVRLGALHLYNDTPGNLSDDQYVDALVMADVAAQSILLLQAHAPPGALALELESDANFQYVVHQASGMVAAQLEITVSQALIRLRAHAFGNGRSLTQVAREIVGGRLRFDAASGEDDPTP